ncbi:MAG: hypothetical protein M1833_000819 [Piccolia ochrophora]|nr:MAG: hypothetical protein M1833_000819 [Piccolia ochrophora]
MDEPIESSQPTSRRTAKDSATPNTASHITAGEKTQLPRAQSPTSIAPTKAMSSLSPTAMPPREISISPPLESQETKSSVARTPTPPTAPFSSPPPTSRTLMRSADAPTDIPFTLPTPSTLSNASPDELRSLLQKSADEIGQLSGSLRDAYTSAAHHKLQHNLLSIETEEAAKRMAVEYEMTRREVEVLQSEQASRHYHRRGLQSPPALPDASLLLQNRLSLELKGTCSALQADNEILRRRLRRAKKAIQLRDGEAASLAEENARLRKRIAENREHFNRLRRPGGLYDVRATDPYLTPQRSTPNSRPTPNPPSTSRSSHRHHAPTHTPSADDTFAATLLAADQFLTQENASAPSTPTRTRASLSGRPVHHHGGHGHTRGTHSLSSLPTTPHQLSRPTTSASTTLLPPVSFSPINPQQATPTTTNNNHAVKPSPRRRESRDSTISAPDEPIPNPTSKTPTTSSTATTTSTSIATASDDIPITESRASRAATNMLRRSPATKRGGGASRAAVHASEKTGKNGNNMTQAKIWGPVRKAGGGGGGGAGQKRKHDGDGEGEDVLAAAAKKRRVKMGAGMGEGVGLGIGGVARG